MEEEKLIKYLQDIVELETQKRIAENTYNKLSIMEKDNAYAKYAAPEEIGNTSGVAAKIRWLPLIGKLWLGIYVAAFAAFLVKWVFIFVFGSMGMEPSHTSIEMFSLFVCLAVVWIWIVKKEISVAQHSIERDQTSKRQYMENVRKGKIILAQIEKEKPNLSVVYDQCEQSLKKLYGLNIVHPDYQYFEACGMFLQYLSTGRTHSLEQKGGDKGAYNLYDEDLKFHTIKRQLNQVLKNQQVLYGALTQINSNVENLCSSVGKIEQYAHQTAQNTKISTWCNAATAANTYAMRRMQEEYLFYR